MASRLLIILLLGVCVAASASQDVGGCSCWTGWVEFRNRCFAVFKSLKTWSDSELYCVSLGSNLVSIQNDGSYKFLRALIRRTTGKNTNVWVGGHDTVKEGAWMWSDGSKFDFKRWGKKQPDNYGKKEHCMEMNASEKDVVNDAPCHWTKYFVCEKSK